LEGIAPQFKGAGSHRRRVFLCPSCTNILNARESFCPTCKMAFKSTLKAKFRSLLIPGGGYFYNSYMLPGIAVGLLETVLLICLTYRLAALNARMPGSFGTIAVLAGLLVAEKFIATYHAQHLIEDFIPEEKNFALRKI
jgi:hypothetical protein